MRGVSRRIRGLYGIVDSTYVEPCGLEKASRRVLEGGVKLLQLRAKEWGGGELLRAARLLRALTSDYGAVFIVNDRVDVAMMSRADGVHLGASDIPPEEARSLLGPSAIIGLSTHSLGEALEAEKRGVDYISFGPVFATRTKKDAEEPKGLDSLRAVKERVRLPVVAIGGITVKALPGVLETGVDSVAMISEVLASGDVAEKVSSIVSTINARRPKE